MEGRNGENHGKPKTVNQETISLAKTNNHEANGRNVLIKCWNVKFGI